MTYIPLYRPYLSVCNHLSTSTYSFTYVSYAFVCLSIHLSIYLSVLVHLVYVFTYLSMYSYLSMNKPITVFLCLFDSLFIYLYASIYRSVYLSIPIYTYLLIFTKYSSTCQFVCRSVVSNLHPFHSYIAAYNRL